MDISIKKLMKLLIMSYDAGLGDNEGISASFDFDDISKFFEWEELKISKENLQENWNQLISENIIIKQGNFNSYKINYDKI